MGQIACDKDIRETDRVRFEPRLRHCRDRLASSVGTKRTLQLLLIYYLPAQPQNSAARLNYSKLFYINVLRGEISKFGYVFLASFGATSLRAVHNFRLRPALVASCSE